MKSITKYLGERLKLKVNKEKSTVDRPWGKRFLGFTFYQWYRKIGIRVHEKSIAKLK